jgi:hypothetical protein
MMMFVCLFVRGACLRACVICLSIVDNQIRSIIIDRSALVASSSSSSNQNREGRKVNDHCDAEIWLRLSKSFIIITPHFQRTLKNSEHQAPPTLKKKAQSYTVVTVLYCTVLCCRS